MGVIKRKQQAIENAIQRPWLDDAGAFTIGKYKGQLAETIVKDNPAYIAWIVDNVENITDEERDLLSTMLKYRNRI